MGIVAPPKPQGATASVCLRRSDIGKGNAGFATLGSDADHLFDAVAAGVELGTPARLETQSEIARLAPVKRNDFFHRIGRLHLDRRHAEGLAGKVEVHIDSSPSGFAFYHHRPWVQRNAKKFGVHPLLLVNPYAAERRFDANRGVFAASARRPGDVNPRDKEITGHAQPGERQHDNTCEYGGHGRHQAAGRWFRRGGRWQRRRRAVHEAVSPSFSIRSTGRTRSVQRMEIRLNPTARPVRKRITPGTAGQIAVSTSHSPPMRLVEARNRRRENLWPISPPTSAPR